MSLKVALVGNPNCGKTTLFNFLTAQNQYVGNWPGVTVEKKEGFLKNNEDVKLVDLPGIYSLTPYTDEEIVTRDYIFNEKPDVVFNVISGVNLRRSLYLTLQLLEIKIPVVLIVTMLDIVEKNGGSINLNLLSKNLNCKVFNAKDIKSCKDFSVLKNKIFYLEEDFSNKFLTYSDGFEKYLNRLQCVLKDAKDFKNDRNKTLQCLEKTNNLELEKDLQKKIDLIKKEMEEEFSEDCNIVLIEQRYKKIEEIYAKCCKNTEKKYTISDKIDKIVTNKFLAIPIFLTSLTAIYFFCINFVGRFFSDFVEKFFKQDVYCFLEKVFSDFYVYGWLKSLILDGILAGVGTVLTFVPQVFLLFFLLCLLEDCGYMSRVAFILDRPFLRFGLSGKSVISFLVSSGCGVNGIMVTKTIKNENSRFLTILTTTFIPCNAKLPIIAIVCSYVFGGSFLTVVLIYFLAIFSVFVLGLILKETNGVNSSSDYFIMELGEYIKPSLKNVLKYAVLNVKSFISKAGSIIFLASILIWFLLNFGFLNGAVKMVSQENSFLAHIGKIISPVFAPLGFGNWKAVVATLSGFFAKENIVNTFAVILKMPSLGSDKSWFNEVFLGDFSALSFLIFNLLCAPCFAAIAAIYRQTLSFKKTLKILLYQTVSAYVLSLVVNQIGGLIFKEINFSVSSVLTIIVIFLVFILILLQKKQNKC